MAPTLVQDLPTPALLVDLEALDRNLATMAGRWPGRTLRPHAKAFKSTAMAHRLAEAGHPGFCVATVREAEGLAAAGLGDDLLVANEVLDAERLGRLVREGARVTVAVDSEATIDAAAGGGVPEVLVDVLVGFRCGCDPDDAGHLAAYARSQGLRVRGVMGYEAHAVGVADRAERADLVDGAMDRLRAAHDQVGGEVVSGGGTGTWDLNDTVTEMQAGSFLLMDTAYNRLDLPFEQVLWHLSTVLSTPPNGAVVTDGGLKSVAVDQGPPEVTGFTVLSCSDEHIILIPGDGTDPPQVGERVRSVPGHCDPTVARHERLHVVRGDDVVDTWPVDLRNW